MAHRMLAPPFSIVLRCYGLFFDPQDNLFSYMLEKIMPMEKKCVFVTNKYVPLKFDGENKAVDSGM
jgi:hypothetical protein